jgi:hypothetical protein
LYTSGGVRLYSIRKQFWIKQTGSVERGSREIFSFSVVHFVPDEEYRYFVEMNKWKNWYFTDREEYAWYRNATEITSLEQLKVLMDKEMIHAFRNWGVSRKRYQDNVD